MYDWELSVANWALWLIKSTYAHLWTFPKSPFSLLLSQPLQAH